MSLVYWLVNTPGLGGLVVITVFLVLLIVYARMLRWIVDGDEVDEK